MWPMSCLAGSSDPGNASTMNGLASGSLSGCTHAAGRFALGLALALQGGMAEGPLQPGESRLLFFHGRFAAFLGGIDEIV